jgi:hypothetical protein
MNAGVTTGLVLPVPAAEDLLAAVGRRHPEAARDGVPAHVTVLFPFLRPEKIDGAVLRTLRELFEQHPPLPVRFTECRRRAEFVHLHPEPADGLRRLLDHARREWPDVIPYEGAYGEVEPHLTVSIRTSEDTAERIHAESGRELPIEAELREGWLISSREQRWTVVERFPLAGESTVH